MYVLAVRIDLHIPRAQSLKAKRAVLRPIIDGCRHRYPVAIAEVDHQDTWQRSALGISAVSSDVSHVEEMIDEVERFVWSFPEIDVTSSGRFWLEIER